jgi:GT2 family glycosyltransferase
MLISVVVPTRNRPRDVERLLPTIEQQTRLPDQIIVVDQSMDDETMAVAKQVMGPGMAERSVYVHDAKIKGVSAARNVGISLATGDVVVFLDDDVLLSPDCFEQLEKAFDANPEYAGIGGVELQMEKSALSYILYYDIFFVGPFKDRKYRISRDWRHLHGIQPVTALKTCLAGFRRDFLARNRFDERWRSALLEDVELCWRVRGRQKFGIWPQASAWHAISEVRTGGRAGYRATGAAWIFFMRSLIKPEWPLLPLYAWLWVGLWVNAARRSLVSKSFDPAVGLFQGGMSVFQPSLALPFIDAAAEPFPDRSAYAPSR